MASAASRSSPRIHGGTADHSGSVLAGTAPNGSASANVVSIIIHGDITGNAADISTTADSSGQVDAYSISSFTQYGSLVGSNVPTSGSILAIGSIGHVSLHAGGAPQVQFSQAPVRVPVRFTRAQPWGLSPLRASLAPSPERLQVRAPEKYQPVALWMRYNWRRHRWRRGDRQRRHCDRNRIWRQFWFSDDHKRGITGGSGDDSGQVTAGKNSLGKIGWLPVTW